MITEQYGVELGMPSQYRHALQSAPGFVPIAHDWTGGCDEWPPGTEWLN